MELVAQHDPQRGRVLRMKYVLGHTWDEIAPRLGISVNQARYIESQAIEWLRRRYSVSR
jgi:DNA-directed RNA polymerase sigma subunit (sigma70/sigma32)